jgi:hypothetical protein
MHFHRLTLLPTNALTAAPEYVLRTARSIAVHSPLRPKLQDIA